MIEINNPGSTMPLWLAMLACVLCTAPAIAHPVLAFTVTSHKEPLKGMKAANGAEAHPGDETYPLTVTLGHQFLIAESQGRRTIYDFERLRVLQVNLAAKTYTDNSLYADIGFRAAEFQNRLMLGTILQTSKLNFNQMEPALVEQLFSMTNPKGQTNIVQRHVGDATEFFWEKQRLMSVSDKTRELPDGYQTEYWRFLRYYAGGHPKIYAALASIHGAPETITVILANMFTEARRMTLNAIRTDPDAPYSLDGLALTQPDEAPYSTLQVLGPDANAQLALRSEMTVRARDSAFAQANVLDALLANMAFLIMTGDENSTTAWLSQHRDAIQSDESARSLTMNLNLRDKAAAQTAVQALTELHKLPGTMGYVLDVFVGNILLNMRDGTGGNDHLLAALGVNPYLVGAWNDLGGSYYRNFRADKAWACWDAARRMSPQHAMLAPVTAMENKIRATLPQFF